MTVSARKDFVFAGSLDAVSAAREAIMDFVLEHCSVNSEEFDILVAVQEALANAALHGCGNDPSKSIHCSVCVVPEEIDILVRDPGSGFDVERMTAPGSLDNNLSESGRGLGLMRALMSVVEYRRGGCEVHLKKTIGGSRCAGDPLLNRIAV